MVHLDFECVSHFYVRVWSIFICYVSATTVWFPSHFCCLYFRRYDHRLMCVDTIVLVLSGIYPFSSVNPGCFIRMNWDSPWYLVVLVADGTIIYDAYSTLTWWSLAGNCQCQSVLPLFSYFTSWAVKGMGSEPMSLTLQQLFLVRLWVLVLFVDKCVPSTLC